MKTSFKKKYEKNNASLGFLYIIIKFLFNIKGLSKNLTSEINKAIKSFEDPDITSKERKKQFKKLFVFRYIYSLRPTEYYLFNFENASYKERREFVTRQQTARYYSVINSLKHRKIFDKKNLTYEVFSNFYKREMICVKNKKDEQIFTDFIKKHNKFILKPFDGHSGDGVEIIDIDDYKDEEALINHAMKITPFVAEELIKQSKDLGCFHEQSVNTIRVVTFQYKGDFAILWAFLRTGQGDSKVDNMGASGAGAFIDINTGKIISDGIDWKGSKVEKHPDSQIKFKGFQIPRWEELIEVVKNLSNQISKMHCVGWDLALQDDGWVLVEGNARPQCVTVQAYTKKGYRKYYQNMARLVQKEKLDDDKKALNIIKNTNLIKETKSNYEKNTLSSSNISIGFTGDMAFSEYTKDVYKKAENIDKKIYDFFNSNDYNVINFESPVTDMTDTDKAALAHKSNKDSLNFVKNHFKNPILSLANNHMMDFGYKGLFDTLKIIQDEKIDCIGAGKNIDDACNYIILGKETKVGILSFQYKNISSDASLKFEVAHESHEQIIRKKIKELKELVDWVVLIYHGGDEFLNVPMPYSRKKMKKMLNWGADIIVGHHPHTVQGYEKINNKMIFYSLGNFIFDTDYQRAQKGTTDGEIIKIKFNKDSFEFENLNIFIDRRDERIIATDNNNKYFKDIRENYFDGWTKEAKKFHIIKRKKAKLRISREQFSVNELHIEQAGLENYMEFEELIDKHKFEGMNSMPIKSNEKKPEPAPYRYIKRIKNIKYKRHLCILISKLRNK